MQPVNTMLTMVWAKESLGRLIRVEGHLSALFAACRHCNIFTELIHPMRKEVEQVIDRLDKIIKIMERENERQKAVAKQEDSI